MKIAILGSGAIGLASAALFASRGHAPIIWSPSGAGTAGLPQPPRLIATGALAGEWNIAASGDLADAINGADAVLLAVDAGGHVPVMRAAAPLLAPGVPFLIGAAHAMSAVYLSELLAARCVELKLSAADATSAAVIRRLAIEKVASFDKHFRIMLPEREVLGPAGS